MCLEGTCGDGCVYISRNHNQIIQKALDRDRDRGSVCYYFIFIFISFQADVEYDEFVPYRGSNPGDPLERHKVKVAHA